MRYRLHGLTIDSDAALATPRREFPGPPDLVISIGTSSDGTRPAHDVGANDTKILSEDRDALGNLRHALSAAAEGYRLHVPSVFDVMFDSQVQRATVTPVQRPQTDPALLLTGLGLACALALRGETVLHASAAQWRERAIGVLAPGGAGKSTFAALLCAGGARLIADDTLRFRADPTGTWVWRGPEGIRLRENAISHDLVSDTNKVDRSPDGRMQIAAEMTTEDRVHLGCLVVPIPDPVAPGFSSTRLAPREALIAILRAGRLPGRLNGVLEGCRFAAAAELASTLPVLAARVPWRPGCVSVAGPALLAACEDEFTRRVVPPGSSSATSPDSGLR